MGNDHHQPTWLTITVALIAGILGASGIVNLIASYLIKPEIVSEVLSGNITKGTSKPYVATINIKNNGHAPAKDLDLTVTTSTNITNATTILSTENYFVNKTENPKLLHLHIPRFVEGEGSLVSIHMTTEPNKTSAFKKDGVLKKAGVPYGYEDYGVYTTYDTGSSKLIITLIPLFPFYNLAIHTSNPFNLVSNLMVAIYLLVPAAVAVGYLYIKKR